MLFWPQQLHLIPEWQQSIPKAALAAAGSSRDETQQHELPVLQGLGLTLTALAAAPHKVGLAPKIFPVLLVHFFIKWF